MNIESSNAQHRNFLHYDYLYMSHYEARTILKASTRTDFVLKSSIELYLIPFCTDLSMTVDAGSSKVENLHFREYKPDDFQRCVELTADAWHDEITISDWRRLREAYTQLALAKSNWKEMAYLSDEVVGLLFGKIGNQHHGLFSGTKTYIRRLVIIIRALIDQHGQIARPYIVPLVHILTEVKLLINRPKSDAEIVYLLVDSKHRGKGLGSRLVERFINAAISEGASRICVYSDNQASDWKFYGKFGFMQTSIFYDNWSSHFNGKPSKGVIYALSLGKI